MCSCVPGYILTTNTIATTITTTTSTTTDTTTAATATTTTTTEFYHHSYIQNKVRYTHILKKSHFEENINALDQRGKRQSNHVLSKNNDET